MATTNIASITQKNLPASLTTLYTLTTSATVVSAMCVSLDFTNTTASDVTIDVCKEVSGPVDDYFASGLTVPAKGTASWRGIVTLRTNGDLIRALCSAANSVDVVGTVMESDI